MKKHLWGTKRTDMIPFVVTFIVCLHSSSIGIILGTIVHLGMVLSGHVTPMLGKIAAENEDDDLEGFFSKPIDNIKHQKAILF
jgi:hypothetical protein